jgi:unsaturated rhamnogalacturonyl hydrolase
MQWFDPEEALVNDELLAQAADVLLELRYTPWIFGDSIAFEAMIDASRHLTDLRWRDFAHGFVRCWAASVTEYRRLDCTAPGRAFLKIYEDTHDVQILDATRMIVRRRSRSHSDG